MKVNIFKIVRLVDNIDASSKHGSEILNSVVSTSIDFEVETKNGEKISGTYTVDGDEAFDIIDIQCLIRNLFNR